MSSKISKYFSLKEFLNSDVANRKGINNHTTNKDIIANLKALANEVLDPLRLAIGRPLRINSGYRCQELNRAVGGVPTPQHTKGEASDVYTGNANLSFALASKVVELGLPYDQLILYPTFVHISHKRIGEQRGQLLYNKKYKGKML